MTAPSFCQGGSCHAVVMFLVMACAACVTTARPFSVASSTGLAAVVVTFLLDRLAGIHNAQTRIAGTFHLSHRCHGNLLSR